MAPRKITAEVATFIEAAGQNFFRYTRAMDVHLLLLQKDLNAAVVAHADYAAKNPPPFDFMPSVDERNACKTAAEAMLSKDCRTAADHLDAVNAGFFLIQCTSTEATELAGGKDWILNEVLRRSTALEDANPLPHNPENYILRIPENPHPLLQAMLPGPVTPAFDHATTVGHEIDQFPSVVPSPPFKVPEEPYECRQVTKLQLAKWRNKPELIYQKLFVSITDGEEEVFRLVSFADSSERARTFYVQMAEDDEAFAFSGQSFFDLLAESKSLRIVQQ